MISVSILCGRLAYGTECTRMGNSISKIKKEQIFCKINPDRSYNMVCHRKTNVKSHLTVVRGGGGD